MPLRRTFPSDESKYYLFKLSTEVSSGSGRDGKAAAVRKSRTDMARESLSTFGFFFFFKELFIRAALKLRNKDLGRAFKRYFKKNYI